MASSIKRIENPGIEVNEIDRSQYNKVDYSLPNAPAVLNIGFAAKGEDLALTWINSKSTLDDTFGVPTNEYETWFYNANYEILRRGGTCIAAKLPYDNEANGKYNCIELSVSGLKKVAELEQTSLSGRYATVKDLHDTLSSYLLEVNSAHKNDNIESIAKMFNVCQSEYQARFPTKDAKFNTIKELRDNLSAMVMEFAKQSQFTVLNLNDSGLCTYLEIGTKDFTYDNKDTIDGLDEYITGQRRPNPNTIRIYDMTRAQYGKLNSYLNCITISSLSDSEAVLETGECLGIVPVLVAAPNALFFQQLLDFNALRSTPNYDAFNSVSGFTTLKAEYAGHSVSVSFGDISDHVSVPLVSPSNYALGIDGTNYDSLSKRAASTFPAINFKDQAHFDKTYMKYIGVCVFRAYADYDNNGKMGFELLESFVGSFDRKARDPITNSNAFIDDVVNAQSQYIRFFSNVDKDSYEKASTLAVVNQEAVSLGFYSFDCKKHISYMNSIMKPLTHLFDQAANKNTLPIDVVVDGGMSNIAQLAKISEYQYIDVEEKPYVADVKWNIGTGEGQTSDTSGWQAVLNKYDSFCKSVRKDCMFLADGLRAMCLDGSVKHIRKTQPSATVANTILPKFRYMAGVLNSSYSAGYCNWFYQQDYSSQDYFWCPPSIKAAGVYIYCDTYFHSWSAPAGMERGVINDAVDIAFVPLDQDAGQIYSNQWNYAMSYPIEGVVLEGHKTFQRDKTAFDRVNVRRLMLYLERRISRVAQRFVYEGNTAYLRQSFVDTIKPILEDAVQGGGVRDYAIKCDDELNTTEVIENNELRCKIAVRPVKVVDYIVIDFICTRQSANVSEEVLK